jgi:large subunit ribosomal protein L4
VELSVHKIGKKSLAKVEAPDSVFNARYNEPLVHQVVTAYLAGARTGTKAQKTRAEVRGGGRKPWRQKGTGRARAGTIRSPLWRGGGVTFAAKPRDHAQKINKKMYRGAMCAILSELARQQRLLVVDEIKLEQPKTKLLAAQLAELQAGEVLIVTDALTDNLSLAARNLPHVDVISDGEINPYNLIGFEKVMLTAAALKRIGERLA